MTLCCVNECYVYFEKSKGRCTAVLGRYLLRVMLEAAGPSRLQGCMSAPRESSGAIRLFSSYRAGYQRVGVAISKQVLV